MLTEPGSPRTGVAGGCDPVGMCGCWGPNSCPLHERNMFLPSEPSL